jgi:hypothetical protein
VVISACKHFVSYKIVDSIADNIINDFRKQHALRGLDLTASDADIIETARRRANNIAMILSAVKEDWAAEEIMPIRVCKANIQEPKGDTLEARKNVSPACIGGVGNCEKCMQGQLKPAISNCVLYKQSGSHTPVVTL